MEDIIVRHENIGTLIWSKKYKCYFIAKDKRYKQEIKDILAKKKNDGKIYDELKKIGMNGKVKEIFSDNKQELMAPLEYYFDFTNVCNLKCSHCYNRKNMNNTTMSKTQIEKIITDMYQNGIMRLHLAGGEPTLFSEELNTYLATANKYGIVVSMATNGTMITEEICDIIAKNNIMSITISIESAEESKNAKIRGKGNLEKAKNGIRKLIDYREKYNKNYLVGIKVSYDVQMGKEDFEKLIQLALELKIDVLKFANPERCLFHEKGYYSKTKDKYYKNIKIIHELKQKYKDQILITQIASPITNCSNIGLPNMKGCIGAQELIAINAKGNITPCLMNNYNLGNIKDYNSISDVYQSDKIKKYYEKIKNYKCEDCEYHKQCRGGCQVRKIVQYGEIKEVDPLCPKNNKEKIEKLTENQKSEFEIFNKVVVVHSL